jgi:hypothetical protein
MKTKERWDIIHAWQESRNITRVANQLGRTRRTVQHWVHHFNKHGNVESGKRTGRPPLLDDSGAGAALQLLLSEEHGTGFKVAQALHAQGTTSKLLHKSTVLRHAKGAAKAEGKPIRAVRGLPGKELTQGTKLKRYNFAKANQGRDWGNVMFTDRKKFHFYYPGVSVKPMKWLRKGEKWTAYKVNHAQVVNLYAGITKHGITKAHIVAGTSKHTSKYTNKKGQTSKNITGAEYEDVLQLTFLPEGQRVFGPVGVSKWVLQQDNDPSHKRASTKVLATHKGKHGCSIELLQNWPPNSPDLNPIENVWGYVQGKVNARGCKTFDTYKAVVLAELRGVPKSMLTNLFASMPKRLAVCIKAKGGKTTY